MGFESRIYSVDIMVYCNYESELIVMEIISTAVLPDLSGFDALSNLDHSFNQMQGMPSYFQAMEGGRPLGALTVFAPTADTAEVTAHVLPAHRRQGIFRALLSAGEGVLRQWGYHQLLFVCSGDSPDGQAVAAHWALGLHHAEYLMAWGGAPLPASPLPLELRPAREEDLPEMIPLHAAAYGETPEQTEGFLRQALDACWCGWLDGDLLACASAGVGENISIYGVAVHPQRQGQGIGRALMVTLLDRLAPQRKQIVLEVDSINQRALKLYRSCGFTERQRVDYYFRPL